MVSRSRISPIRMQSGAWRSAFFSADLQRLRVAPTSRWLTTDFLFANRNSIGSSMVRMCPAIFGCAIRASRPAWCSLPVPVAPTISTRPRFSSTRSTAAAACSGESSAGMSVGCSGRRRPSCRAGLKPDRRKLPTPAGRCRRSARRCRPAPRTASASAPRPAAGAICGGVSDLVRQLQDLAVILIRRRVWPTDRRRTRSLSAIRRRTLLHVAQSSPAVASQLPGMLPFILAAVR